jgi:methionyl aminopeptidase
VIAAGDLDQYRRLGAQGRYISATPARRSALEPMPARTERLLRDGKRAMWLGINQVKTGNRLCGNR